MRPRLPRRAPDSPRVTGRRGAATARIVAVLFLGTALREPAAAQPVARAAWDSALTAATQGDDRQTERLLARLRGEARSAADRRLAQAGDRLEASLWELRGCADSAERILRTAGATAPSGEHATADALVRLLARRGRPGEARAVLVRSYGTVSGVGSTVSRESLGFLQGLAAVDRADGHEASALASLQAALALATQLEARGRPLPPPSAEPRATPLTAWVLMDLVLLRQEARSADVASSREAARLLDALALAPGVLDADTEGPWVARLGDRRTVAEAACRASGRPCPPPVPRRGC